MKDAAPNIFRLLETSGGRDGFDAIVTAAVAEYGALRAPGDAQARRLGRLVAPVWNKLANETKRSLAATLSHSPRVPREIIDGLLDAPIEIAAPFLVSSPCLSPEDLARMESSGDERVARIAAGRRSARPQAPTPAAPARSGKRDPQAANGADAPAPSSPPPAVAPGHGKRQAAAAPARAAASPPPAKSAASVREELRRLVLTGSKASRPATAAASVRELVELARSGDFARFYASLAVALGVDADRVEPIVADESGERLATALHTLKANPADAMTVLMMTTPAVGLDVAAFKTMQAFYRTLQSERRAEAANKSERRPVLAAPSLQPDAADLRSLDRPAPRAQFGRRRSLPNNRPDFGKTG